MERQDTEQRFNELWDSVIPEAKTSSAFTSIPDDVKKYDSQHVAMKDMHRNRERALSIIDSVVLQ